MTYRLGGSSCASTNVLISGLPITACDRSSSTGGRVSSNTTPSFLSSSTDLVGGNRVVKNVSSILSNLAGNAIGSSVLEFVGDGLRRLLIFGRSTEREIESRIESIERRPVWLVIILLNLSNVDDELGGRREARGGICDQVGSSSDENGMESRT